ncbi:MAG: radical SAM protein, partial [Burkholderiales bacterium]
ELLRAELAKPGYVCDSISLGTNTDPYQPIEREYRITRGILELLAEHDHPVAIVTKSATVERDIDLLAPMAAKNLARVLLSIATLDHDVSRPMEPRTSAPRRRLEAIRRLSAAGIPTGVVVAPVVPFLTDHDIEHVLYAAAEAGATSAGYVLLRLPFEVKDLFKAWLEQHFPLKAAHVMSRVREMRDGRENDPEFGSRMKGTGLFAELLGKRFKLACVRLGLHQDRAALDTSQFRPPKTSPQLDLF